MTVPAASNASKCTCDPRLPWVGIRSELVMRNCLRPSLERYTPGAISLYPEPNHFSAEFKATAEEIGLWLPIFPHPSRIVPPDTAAGSFSPPIAGIRGRPAIPAGVCGPVSGSPRRNECVGSTPNSRVTSSGSRLSARMPKVTSITISSLKKLLPHFDGWRPTADPGSSSKVVFAAQTKTPLC